MQGQLFFLVFLFLSLHRGAAQIRLWNECNKFEREYFATNDLTMYAKFSPGAWFEVVHALKFTTATGRLKVAWSDGSPQTDVLPEDAWVVKPTTDIPETDDWVACKISGTNNAGNMAVVQFTKIIDGMTFEGKNFETVYRCVRDVATFKRLEYSSCLRANECSFSLPAGVEGVNADGCAENAVLLENTECLLQCKAGFESANSNGHKLTCLDKGGATRKAVISGSCTAAPCPINSARNQTTDECICNTGYNGLITAIRTEPYYSGECADVLCKFDNGLGYSVVPDDRRGDACSNETNLNSLPQDAKFDPTCDVKCDTDLGFSEASGVYACYQGSLQPKLELNCTACTSMDIDRVEDMRTLGLQLDKNLPSDKTNSCGGWYGLGGSPVLELKGPGMVILEFGNCGKGGRVTLFVDDKKIAETSSRLVAAFAISDLSKVQLQAEAPDAVMSIISVSIHCTKAQSTKIFGTCPEDPEGSKDPEKYHGRVSRHMCEQAKKAPEYPFYTYSGGQDECFSSRTCRSPKTASSKSNIFVRHGWYLGAAGSDCRSTCSTVGLTCSLAGLMAHHHEVAASQKAQALLVQNLKVGSIALQELYNTTVNIKTPCDSVQQMSVPHVQKHGGQCSVWGSSNRPVSQFDCAAKNPLFRRLCYCAGPAVPIFNQASCPYPLKAGYYFSGPDTCDQKRCSNAEVGEFYSGTGGLDGQCSVQKCKDATLGVQFAEAWSDSPFTCKIESCPNDPPVGYRFEKSGSCNAVPCSNGAAGKYYTSPGNEDGTCNVADCTDPSPGYGFIAGGVSVAADKCRVELCENVKKVGKGFSFDKFCEIEKCVNAPTGHYYFGSGVKKNECPHKPCEAVLRKGFLSGWANEPTTCPSETCVKAKVGYFLRPGSCVQHQCTTAPSGKYYTAQQKCEEVANCTNRGVKQYYIPGWSENSLSCPVANCKDPVHPGFYLQTRSDAGCDAKQCSKAPVGHYYISPGGTTDTCSFMPCTNANDGEYYVAGFRTDNQCPTQPCNQAQLRNGYHFAGNHSAAQDNDRCQVVPCPAVLGRYFMAPSLGLAGCAHVLARCTNVAAGKKFLPSATDPPLITNNCSVVDCPAAAVGRYYGIAGTCDARNCTNAPLAARYSSGGNDKGECEYDMCPSAGVGEYYTINPKKPCETTKCPDKLGYRFTESGSCTSMSCGLKPCTAITTPITNTITTITTTTQSEAEENTESEAEENAEDLTMLTAAVSIASAVLVLLVLAAVLFLLRRKICDNQSTLISEDKEVEMIDHRSKAEEIASSAMNCLELKDFLLKPTDVILGTRIAGGMGGQIFTGTFGLQQVALKESFEMIMNDYNSEMVKEAVMMTKLRHPNIVQFFGIWEYSEDETRVFLVMELCPNGDLHAAAQSCSSTLSDRQKWTRQISSAMRYLHTRSPPVIHRDLKAQNVLLDVHRMAKVCDFGASKAVESGRDMTLGIGTVAYMPPEVMNKFSDDETQCSVDAPKCDVFSFAVLALYITTGVMPHEGLSNKDIFVKVGMAAKRTPVPPGYYKDEDDDDDDTYPDFVALVERMWHQDPDARPGFDIILAELTDMFSESKPYLDNSDTDSPTHTKPKGK